MPIDGYAAVVARALATYRLRLPLPATFAAVVLTACGDDGAGGAGDTAVADTGGAGDTAPADTDNEVAPDIGDDAIDDTATAETVMCGSITCDEPPAPACSPDRLARWTYGTEGACELDASGFPLCRYPVTDQRCDEGMACRLDGDAPVCGLPRTTCEVALSRVGSWISKAVLPTADAPCCFDYDSDGQIDNGLADLAAQIAPVFDANPQEFVDAFIRRGLNAYLLQYRGLDDVSNDQALTIDMLLGLDADGSYDENLLGTERFAVRSGSYDQATPKSTFNSAVITDGALRARSSTMSFLLPLAVEPFAASISDVRFDARVVLGDNGRGLSLRPGSGDTLGARFGALFPLSEVFRAVNAFASGGCGCLDLGGVELVTEAGGQWQCNPADSSACSPEDPDESLCKDLASFCGAAILLLEPDVGDAFSIGLWVEGVSAGFDGFVGADDAPLTCP